MIKKELYTTRSDGIKLYRTYSDVGYIIKQIETGNEYSEAIDIEGSEYTYEETDKYPEVIEPDSMHVASRLENLEASTDALLGIK